MIQQFGIDMFIKDPWNSLNHSSSENLDAYLARELSAETRLAVNNNIVNIINAHPNTPIKSKDQKLEAPGAFQISGALS